MRLADPPGARSCRDGGDWELARDERGTSRLYTDLEELLGPLAESEKAVLVEDIRQKMKRATIGKLTYGRGRAFDVDRIESTHCVLEIRVIDHACPTGGVELVQRHTRVYFTEPAELPRCLLFLSLKSKCPGPEGVAEQNTHAALAQRLADEHCRKL